MPANSPFSAATAHDFHAMLAPIFDVYRHEGMERYVAAMVGCSTGVHPPFDDLTTACVGHIFWALTAHDRIVENFSGTLKRLAKLLISKIREMNDEAEITCEEPANALPSRVEGTIIQWCGSIHPFTCGGCDRRTPLFITLENELLCLRCGYRQCVVTNEILYSPKGQTTVIRAPRAPQPPQPAEAASLSDGYHTLQELYDHRHALTLALVASGVPAWISTQHAAGDVPMYEGYFIIGLDLSSRLGGTYEVRYHMPLKYWQTALRAGAEARLEAPPWDGRSQNVEALLDFALNKRQSLR